MRRVIILVPLLLATTFTVGASQPQPTSSITIEQLAERILKAEAGLVARLKAFKPIMEVYAQYVESHETLGTVPIRDEYFLGQFEWAPNFGPSLKRLTPEKAKGMSDWLVRPFGGMQLKPEGFAAMTVPDWRLMNASNYRFSFLRKEFLGEVRCLVLDVEPKDPRNGFTGRIWVEDRDFNIVRFNGITRSIPGSTITSKKYWFNVDSWRTNVFPGMWLPSYVYAEQQDEDTRDAKLKSQVRIWGYDLKSIRPPQEFTTIEIGDSSIVDASEQPQQLSPTESQRLWDRQAEENVLERLSKAGLLAPYGEVDKILETVTRNLQITNNLPTDTPIKARVLLTSPLESFTIGRTIVLSRGLIDVLPDEASLAMVLAHELSHISLGHRVIDPKFAFADRLMVPDDELLSTVRFRHDATEENAADGHVIELLKNSPYKDTLADAGLFLRVVNENALKLKNLIQPHIGEHTGGEGQQRRLNELIQKSPMLEPGRVDQIAALPLGGRIVMNPWSSQVELLRGASVAPTSAREKSSMAVTPLVPYLRYAEAKTLTP
jgi:hypothetical protein